MNFILTVAFLLLYSEVTSQSTPDSDSTQQVSVNETQSNVDLSQLKDKYRSEHHKIMLERIDIAKQLQTISHDLETKLYDAMVKVAELRKEIEFVEKVRNSVKKIRKASTFFFDDDSNEISLPKFDKNLDNLFTEFGGLEEEQTKLIGEMTSAFHNPKPYSVLDNVGELIVQARGLIGAKSNCLKKTAEEMKMAARADADLNEEKEKNFEGHLKIVFGKLGQVLALETQVQKYLVKEMKESEKIIDWMTTKSAKSNEKVVEKDSGIEIFVNLHKRWAHQVEDGLQMLKAILQKIISTLYHRHYATLDNIVSDELEAINKIIDKNFKGTEKEFLANFGIKDEEVLKKESEHIDIIEEGWELMASVATELKIEVIDVVNRENEKHSDQ